MKSYSTWAPHFEKAYVFKFELRWQHLCLLSPSALIRLKRLSNRESPFSLSTDDAIFLLFSVFNYANVCVSLCEYVHVHAGALKDKKRAIDTLELELWKIVKNHMGAGQ